MKYFLAIILVSFSLSHSQDNFSVKDSSVSYSHTRLDTSSTNFLKESICYNYCSLVAIKKLIKNRTGDLSSEDQMKIYFSLKQKFQVQEQMYFDLTGKKFSIDSCSIDSEEEHR